MNNKPTRKQKMEYLRFEKNWTLQMIADKFNLSRERVRQIIGNTGNVYWKHRREILHDLLNDENLTNGDVKEAYGCNVSFNGERIRHKIESGNRGMGYEKECLVSSKLKELKIKHTLMKNSHPYDIELENGKRVEVKSSKPNKQSRISDLFSFNLEIKSRGKYTDFFILVPLSDEIKDDYFIIPFDEVTSINSPIRFCWPPSICGKKSKWAKYHNRFDLLMAVEALEKEKEK